MTGAQPRNGNLTLGAALVVAALCIAFGANAVAIKICLAEFGSLTLAATRFASAAVIITLWALATGKRLRLKQGQLKQLALLSVGFALQIGLFYVGLDKTNASRGTLIANLQPFLVLVLAHFFVPGDKITVRKAVGITLGFLGVAILFIGDEQVSDAVRTGDLIVLGAVVCWGGTAVYIKRIIHDFEPFQIAAYPMYFTAPLLLVAALIWDRPMLGVLNPTVIGALLYQILVTASFGFVLWNTIQQKYGVVALYSYVFLIPISGVTFGGLLLDEPVATLSMLGALGLIVVGILVVNLRRRGIEGSAPTRSG
jgi:drug/metabolite transporter (DMT)-like permease